MGISINRVYGPFFFEGNLTKLIMILQFSFFLENIDSVNCLSNLKNDFLPQVNRVRKRNAVFQQDGAPVHYGREVIQFLDDKFQGRWLGRCGPLTWIPRSSDMTPMDFFVWVYLKTRFYNKTPRNLPQLKDLIRKEANSISKEFRENLFKNSELF